MTAVFARSPLQSLPIATNRTTMRRRSARQAFDEDDAPVAKKPRTEVNGTGKKANGAAKKTSRASYDEDDDGFQFTRRTTRKSAKGLAAPEPIPEEPAKPVTSRQKKKTIAAPEPAPEPSEPQTRRRSTRLSGDKQQLDTQPAPVKPPPKRSRKSTSTEKKNNERKKQITPVAEAQPEEKSTFARVQTPLQNELHVAKKRVDGVTKIMLPFADTPVINRNKEMRKGSKEGHRRSSTGLRGRRASSLIESGQSNALPHAEVEVRDFYKYIEQSLMEPRRMKQLLTWCGSRALLDKPSGEVRNSNAIMAARAIQQELIDDFASKPELSDWFSREEVAPTQIVEKPNPQNEKNQATLLELEEEVKRLEEETASWEALASTSTSKPPPPPPSIQTPTPSFAEIDSTLLDPSQSSIISALNTLHVQPQRTAASSEPEIKPPSSAFTFTTSSALQTHLAELSQSLEPNIDLFADGVHKIEQYRNTADRVADRILGTATQRLDERDKRGKEQAASEGIGVGDVLRGLAGVLNKES